jgi:hypothetical protein
MKQKGGSVASDAVMSLVNPDTYALMSHRFTNQTGGMKHCSKCGGSIQKHHKCQHKGGSGFSDLLSSANKVLTPGSGGGVSRKKGGSGFSDLLSSANKVLTPGSGGGVSRKKGGACQNDQCRKSNYNEVLKSFLDLNKKGGNNIKSLDELESPYAYSLKNQKGGSDPLSLNYSNIRASGNPAGPGGPDVSSSTRMLASEQVNIMPLMQKNIEYGLVNESAQPFTYTTQNLMVPAQKGGKTKKPKQKNKTSQKNKKSQSNTINKNKEFVKSMKNIALNK